MLRISSHRELESPRAYLRIECHPWRKFFLYLVFLALLSGCAPKTISMDDKRKDSLKGTTLLVIRYPSPAFQLSNRYESWALVFGFPYSYAAVPFMDDFAESKGREYQNSVTTLDPTNGISAKVGRVLNEKFALRRVSVCFPKKLEPDECRNANKVNEYNNILEIEVPLWAVMPDDGVTTDYQLIYKINMTLSDFDEGTVIARRQCSYVTPSNGLFTIDYFDQNQEKILSDQFGQARMECAQEIVDYILGYKKIAKK